MAKKQQRKVQYLREWREYRDLSLGRLALRLEKEPGEETISRQSLSRMELGEQTIPPEMLFALAEALDCGPEDILLVNPLIEPEVVDLMAAVRRIREMQDPAKIVQATKNVLAAA